MKPYEEIKSQQGILKAKISSAIQHFEETTGVKINSISATTIKELTHCGFIPIRTDIEITYQELK